MWAIDVHGHFGRYDRGRDGLGDRLMSADIEIVRRRAAAADIRVTAVSATRALMPYGGDVLAGNEDARRAAEQHDDIRFWAVLDPRLPATYDQVASLLGRPRCAGIKIHPHAHRYEIREHGSAIFAFAAEHHALVLTHSGDPGSYPEDFIPFADRFPNVRLILAHLGNSDDGSLSRQVYAIERARHGNVFVDTSSARSLVSGLIEWAVGEIGPERILFGTDTPLYFAASQKARIDAAEIADEAKRAILAGNASTLLQEVWGDLGSADVGRPEP